MLRATIHYPNAHSFTPREAAYDIAIGWLYLAFHSKTEDINEFASEDQKTRRRAIRNQIAKLHNRLLDKSGLDGIALPEGEEDEK